jgi:hypothetical protein
MPANRHLRGSPRHFPASQVASRKTGSPREILWSALSRLKKHRSPCSVSPQTVPHSSYNIVGKSAALSAAVAGGWAGTRRRSRFALRRAAAIQASIVPDRRLRPKLADNRPSLLLDLWCFLIHCTRLAWRLSLKPMRWSRLHWRTEALSRRRDPGSQGYVLLRSARHAMLRASRYRGHALC